MQVGSGKQQQFYIPSDDSSKNKYEIFIYSDMFKKISTKKVGYETDINSIYNPYNEFKNLLLNLYLFKDDKSINIFNNLIKYTTIDTYATINNMLSGNIQNINKIISNIQNKEQCKKNELLYKKSIFDKNHSFDDSQVENFKKMKNMCESYPQKLYISDNELAIFFKIFKTNNYKNNLNNYVIENFKNRYGREINSYITNYKLGGSNILKTLQNFRNIPNINKNKSILKEKLKIFLDTKVREYQNELSIQLNILKNHFTSYYKQINNFSNKKMQYNQNEKNRYNDNKDIYNNDNEKNKNIDNIILEKEKLLWKQIMVNGEINHDAFLYTLELYKENLNDLLNFKKSGYMDKNIRESYINYFNFLIELTEYLISDIKLLKSLDTKYGNMSIINILDLYKTSLMDKNLYINEYSNIITHFQNLIENVILEQL